MARATHLTISTADRIRLDGRGGRGNEDGREEGENEVRQEVQVSVTYVLDPGDTDLTALAAEKSGEVRSAHEAAWNRIGALGGNAHVCACRDGNDDEPEGTDGLEGSDEPDDIPRKSGWYLPGASRSQNGTGSQNGTSSHNGMSGQGHVPAPEPEADAEPLTGPQKILIRSRAAKAGLTTYALETLLFQQFKVWRVERLSKAQAASLLTALERDLKERVKK